MNTAARVPCVMAGIQEEINISSAMLAGMMDLRTIGAQDRKRALAAALTQKRRTLAAFCYSPFWDDIHERWGGVFAPACTLADAIAALLAIIDDLIVGALRGECTTAGLHFAIECYNDLVNAYDLNGDLWNGELYDLVLTLERITSTTDAVVLVRQALPRLRRRLAHAR